MGNDVTPLTLGNYLTVGEAAETLGVSRSTLRNWDKAGKLKPYRHPVNGYRLYSRNELETLLKVVQSTQ
ncbi:MAG: MerR family DNA-binding transcriptional regulator [Methylobacter sp.]|jgi:excisionase family DNA binding protein|nr:MAG: MerR family DNA-binding transcriptional regulator [Methylobacter sp.]